jgi:hypothetical protein
MVDRFDSRFGSGLWRDLDTDVGRRTCGSCCRPCHAHALAILFDLDFVQPGFVEKPGKLVDQLTIDD